MPQLNDLLVITIPKVLEDCEVVIDQNRIGFTHLPGKIERVLARAGPSRSERVSEVEVLIEPAFKHPVVDRLQVALHVRPCFGRKQDIVSLCRPPSSGNGKDAAKSLPFSLHPFRSHLRLDPRTSGRRLPSRPTERICTHQEMRRLFVVRDSECHCVRRSVLVVDERS